MGGRSGTFRNKHEGGGITTKMLPELEGSDWYKNHAGNIREKYLDAMNEFNKLPEDEQFRRGAWRILYTESLLSPVALVAHHQWNIDHPDSDIGFDQKIESLLGPEYNKSIITPEARKRATAYVKKYFNKGMMNKDARTWGRNAWADWDSGLYMDNPKFFKLNGAMSREQADDIDRKQLARLMK